MKKRKKKYTLADFIPKEVIDSFIQEQEETMDEAMQEVEDELEELEQYIGRELTSDERCGILSTTLQYTIHDESGEYLAEPIPFQKAWEIYQNKKKLLGEFLKQL